MFTLPPLPPKDYILKDVNQNQRSVQEHTPGALPRITQANLAKFLSPVSYQDGERLNNVKVDPVNAQVLDRWTDQQRAFWVDKPGKNDFFLHDISKNYSVEVEPSYDARYKHKESVFYRSFKHELECLEHARLQRLYRKTKREEDEDHAFYAAKEARRNAIKQKRQAIDLGIMPCKELPPFWWKQTTNDDDNNNSNNNKTNFKNDGATVVDRAYETEFVRWQEEPNFLQPAKSGPCQRRRDMALIGQPFRSEACNWYYNNYPPPDLHLIHKKFA